MRGSTCAARASTGSSSACATAPTSSARSSCSATRSVSGVYRRRRPGGRSLVDRDDGDIDRRLRASLIAAALVSCAPGANALASPTTAGVPSAAPSISASSATTTQVLLAGRVTTAVTEPEQYSAFSDGGSLYAFWTRDSPSPYLSKIQRFDAGARVWQTVFEDDARVGVWKPSAGRLAFVEYREPFQGGGASDEKVLILDLVTGKTVSVDTFALSAATYHGGGGGPRPAGS